MNLQVYCRSPVTSLVKGLPGRDRERRLRVLQPVLCLERAHHSKTLIASGAISL